LAFIGTLINDHDDDLIWARLDMHNDGNVAYRWEIMDRQSGYRSRDSDSRVVMGSLIDGRDESLFKMWCTKSIDASGWNTYRRKITNFQSGNRGGDSKTMSGLLDSK
jgi:hypothetical protein